MQQLEIIAFVTSLVSLQLALVLYIGGFISVAFGKRYADGRASRFAMPVLLLAWLALVVTLITHAIQAGHIPAADMYEFSVSFGWGVLTVVMVFRWRQRNDIVSAAGALTTLAILIYAFTLPVQHQPLPPLLNRTWLLPLHVSFAVIAYGLFALGFVCGALYLIGRRYTASFMPSPIVLDNLGYRSSVLGFGFMTLVIVIGSIWAKTAWGSYWSWDPKETAALVTWLIYVLYLLTRWILGWRGAYCAWFLVAGFLAVLLTFFGNLFFGGLHSYAAI
ncbi:MAG: cytochrome c biogenesis protein CcsA [Dehalococcoidia bacterium]|nr:cytochrome c biogenesis protein CcsA [Dehalococcoidia bacterium]